MKAYILVTGVAFTAILVAHVLRIAAEGAHLFREPSFVVSTLLSMALTSWAVFLLLRKPRI